MRVVVQNESSPGQVLFAFDEVARPQVLKVKWAVAYATHNGCERLIERISEKMGSGTWDDCNKRFIVSLDYGLTQPAALELLADQQNSRVFVAGLEALENKGLFPLRAYHPKVFLFQEQQRTGYVIGSANLTESALLTNTEVVTVGSATPANSTWTEVWKSLKEGTAELDDEILAAYKKVWRPAPPRVEAEPVPPVTDIEPADTPVFWDAVEAGLDPSAYQHFWVEAGSMSSGGSHNQLELPRGANRFFGYAFSDYGSDHQLIGHPEITIRTLHWDNRRLTWHGNNRMERINLPTASQGGERYVGTAILFRRKPATFELRVVPWDDKEADAWRAASEQLSRTFRLGRVGKRVCGLF